MDGEGEGDPREDTGDADRDEVYDEGGEVGAAVGGAPAAEEAFVVGGRRGSSGTE